MLLVFPCFSRLVTDPVALQEMALVCSSYNVEFKLLWEYHKLDSNRDLNRKKDFVLADTPRNARRERNDDQIEHFLIG